MKEQVKIKCDRCGSEFEKDELQRSCANCFACTNCEIYACPNCRAEIIVVPMKKKN